MNNPSTNPTPGKTVDEPTPEPLLPPPIWRLLNPGEMRQFGDEGYHQYDGFGRWMPLSEVDLGLQETNGHFLMPVRRKIEDLRQPAPVESGAKHLLDWAESIICNALPMSHCPKEEWLRIVKEWRDEKHGIAPLQQEGTPLSQLAYEAMPVYMNPDGTCTKRRVVNLADAEQALHAAEARVKDLNEELVQAILSRNAGYDEIRKLNAELTTLQQENGRLRGALEGTVWALEKLKAQGCFGQGLETVLSAAKEALKPDGARAEQQGEPS